MDVYAGSIIGVLALCLLSVLLAIYSGSSKGRAKALSGPVLPDDDDNVLYRINRAHMNSVEALAPFVVPAVLAMMVGVGPTTLAVLVWAHVAIRLLHLMIYRRGGEAAKGGSVRTMRGDRLVGVSPAAQLRLVQSFKVAATIADRRRVEKSSSPQEFCTQTLKGGAVAIAKRSSSGQYGDKTIDLVISELLWIALVALVLPLDKSANHSNC
ncbi:MAPEG family protein [Rhizobium leguminosarum]|uniref:MAPEG family protein n=1 Tax=Rhizobium leguminosarum TaxID=384 RepID=UPI0014422873|nr:MAPEG family protein [Rhizobium leguminosarum]MBY5863440.1 MAPEG family protein [Rhizobium leguminosarum]NKM04318.1 hypothetical protein [Rhizobium leguminosarum bv. viciae]